MVTTTMAKWGRIPDIIGDGVSEQDEIMTAICEAKGSTYDGTDCAGELDDSKLRVSWNRAFLHLSLGSTPPSPLLVYNIALSHPHEVRPRNTLTPQFKSSP